MRRKLTSETAAESTDIFTVPVYLSDNGTSGPFRPGTPYTTDLVLSFPRSETLAMGTLEIMHRIDRSPGGKEFETVAIGLVFDPRPSTEVRVIIDRPAELLGAAILDLVGRTAMVPARSPSAARSLTSGAPLSDHFRLLPPGTGAPVDPEGRRRGANPRPRGRHPDARPRTAHPARALGRRGGKRLG